MSIEIEQLTEADFYLMNDLLSNEERSIREKVRLFCEKEVTPIINHYWERAEFPFELLPKIAALRVAGGNIQGYECPGMSSIALGLMTMECARGDSSLCTFMSAHSGSAMNSIAMLGSEEQKRYWLPPMARMEKIGAFALTEADHGSDAGSLETRAHGIGDEYIINGSKRWIVNAFIADVVVIWARDDDGNVGGFLVEKGMPGFEVEIIPGKVAKRALWFTNIRLDNVHVPRENRLVHARHFKNATQVLTATRAIVAWEALGHATAAYEIALAYAKKRIQFGQSLASFQLIQSKLAGMLSKITSMQFLSLRLSQLEEEDKMTAPMAALAKMNNARLAREVVADAREMLGANGIMLDNHIARFHADMEAVFTYDGTDSIQSLIVGQAITGIQAFKSLGA